MKLFQCVAYPVKLTVLIITALMITPFKGFCGKLFDAGVHFTIASPRGEFRDNVDRNGFGASGFSVYRLGSSPLNWFGIRIYRIWS